MNRIESNKSYLEHNADPEERHQVVEVGECAVHQVDGVEVKECKRVGNKGHYAHIHEHRALQQNLELEQDRNYLKLLLPPSPPAPLKLLDIAHFFLLRIPMRNKSKMWFYPTSGQF